MVTQLRWADGAVDEGSDRIVVASCHGTFRPRPPETVTAEGEWVEPGQVLGMIVNGSNESSVVAPCRAAVVAFVVQDGDRVRPGDGLVHLEAV